MDKISFPYRAATHLQLLHVISESGSWEKYGLEVNYNYQILKKDAHRAVANGEVEFVGGNHISTYGHRARGDQWVYLGQTLNAVHPKMVVRPDSGINSIADLKDKKVASHGSHPGLNDWLLLKQRGLDCDLEQVEIVWKKDLKQDTDAKHRRNDHTPLWHLVRDRQVDAVFLQETPVSLFAEDAGLKVIDVEPLPMIWFTTISSSLSFVRKHPDLVDRFLKGIIDGIHFFKTEPEKSIKIIQDRFVEEDELNLAQATYVYQQLAPLLEPRLLPSMAAISNVYEEAKRIDEDAKKINPLALWDLHHIRHLDDSGVIDALYASKPEPAASETVYPDYQAEKAKRQTQIIEAVKACGHPLHKACGCEDD